LSQKIHEKNHIAGEKNKTPVGGRKLRFCTNDVRTKSLVGEIPTPLEKS